MVAVSFFGFVSAELRHQIIKISFIQIFSKTDQVCVLGKISYTLPSSISDQVCVLGKIYAVLSLIVGNVLYSTLSSTQS